MDTLELIKTRRSIRQFSDKPVSDDDIKKIIDAAIWAPSGLNNQPWQFAVIRDRKLKEEISELTHYSKTVLGSNVLIAVFMDNELSYDRTKDAMAIGACIQNMLLLIHSLGLGAVWLGQILKNKDKVLKLLDGDERLELMAVLAIGYPASEGKKGKRKDADELVFFSK